MTTRGQIIEQGIAKLVEMEASWRIPHGVSSSSIDTNLGVNDSSGHLENVAAPDAQGFTTMPSHAFSNRKGVQVLAIDLVRYSWNEDAGHSVQDPQEKAPMARVKCTNERDNLAFGELIKWLEKAGGVRRQVARRASSLSHLDRSQLRSMTSKAIPGVFSLRRWATSYSPRCSRSPTLKISAHGGRAERRPVLWRRTSSTTRWENTFAPRMDAMMPPTLPHSGINRGLPGGQQTGEGGGLVWSLNFGMGGGGSGSEPVDRVGVVAMLTPSADMEHGDADMDAWVNWEGDGDS
ncbi:hypothetical protein BC827DRAFT_1156229 [Russula dissimulans]|nr:hypothetical protein BC827DRAFT_1156229 [Russula dissimulans]